MSSVFSHGQLRLYLLKLLGENPRHGYEVIRILEDRFYGLYSPSAGTVYPRLQRMEAEGLVTHSRIGGRNVYSLTSAGRAELEQRSTDLEELEAEIGSSVRSIAEQVKLGVQGPAQEVRQELKHLARELRLQERHRNRTERSQGPAADLAETLRSVLAGMNPAGGKARNDSPRSAKGRKPAAELQKRAREVADLITRAAARPGLSRRQIDDGMALLDDTAERIRGILGAES